MKVVRGRGTLRRRWSAPLKSNIMFSHRKAKKPSLLGVLAVIMNTASDHNIQSWMKITTVEQGMEHIGLVLNLPYHAVFPDILTLAFALEPEHNNAESKGAVSLQQGPSMVLLRGTKPSWCGAGLHGLWGSNIIFCQLKPADAKTRFNKSLKYNIQQSKHKPNSEKNVIVSCQKRET